MEEPKGNLSLEEYRLCCLLSERRCKSRPLRPLASVLHMMARLFPSGEGERAGCLGRVTGSQQEILHFLEGTDGTAPPPNPWRMRLSSRDQEEGYL